MAHVFCNQCGHRNPPESSFCSSCGSVLDRLDDHTVTLAQVDTLLEGQGAADDVVVRMGDLPNDVATLVVRGGSQAGTVLTLSAALTRLGRRAESEISLDDITVSRRHAEIERTAVGYTVRDAGSLNGTYVNGQRIEGSVQLRHGDELQVGKFHLVFFQKAEA